MKQHNLEEIIIKMGEILQKEKETLDNFDDNTLKDLATCLLITLDNRKERVLN
tara:strand:- start:725 stop:883 length:159 start_codon:yes stop_codon:yes gene_type:complete